MGLLGLVVLAASVVGATVLTGRERPGPSQPPAGDEGLPDARIRSLASTGDGTVWAATSEGVSFFDDEGWTTYTTDHGLPADARSVAVTDEGTVWAATLGGVSVLDGQDWVTDTREDGLARDEMMAVTVAEDGTVWVGSLFRGVAARDGGGWLDGKDWTTHSHVSHSSMARTSRADFPGGTVRSVAVADDGTVWAATRGSGVAAFDGREWASHTLDDGLGSDSVSSLAVAPDGTVWAGTRPVRNEMGMEHADGGLSAFDGEEWTTYTTSYVTEDALADNAVESVAVTGDGTVWAGTAAGVSRYDGDAWTNYTTEDGLPGGDVSSLAVTGDGRVLAGTHGAVSVFDGETWSRFGDGGGGNGEDRVGDSDGAGESDAAAHGDWASDWSRVAHDEDVFGGSGQPEMSSVVAGGPGLVAVGADHAAGMEGVAAVWTSPDGQTWQRVAHDEAVFGGPGLQEMSAVAKGGPGLVAVGGEREPGGEEAAGFGDEVAAVWTSPDGQRWSRLAHDEAVFGESDRQRMNAVTAGGPGLVAVGWDINRQAAAVWTSPDGRTWERVDHDEPVLGGTGRQEMHSVTDGGPGLVAAGRDGEAAAVWTSPDGRTWERVTHDEAVLGGTGHQEMHSVTDGGLGLVAVGRDGRHVRQDGGREAAAVWTSPDGRTWSRVDHDEAVFGGSGQQWMASVVEAGPGLVAVGRDGDGDVAAVWTSPDGRTWSQVANDEDVFGYDEHSGHHGGYQRMTSVAAAGAGLVAVGTDTHDGDGEAAAVWVGK